jgi:peptidoglycan/xylan/chitin deacetylase (PgdA/CDA1 family)
MQLPAIFSANPMQRMLAASCLLMLLAACGAGTEEATVTPVMASALLATPAATPTITTRATRIVRLPTPTPDLAERLQAPIPAAGSMFVVSPSLGVTLTHVATSPWSLSLTPDMNTTMFTHASNLGATLNRLTATLPLGAIETPPFALPTPFQLEPTPDGVSRVAKVPIMMYHYLSAPPVDANIYRLDLSVTPELFATHLDRIKAEGYTTISLYDLVANLTGGAPLPEKSVIITFDDGYRDNYENAFPLLVSRDMMATFFVVTDFIDEKRQEYLTWEMIREMYAAGMSIESHGRNHVSLRGKDDDYLIWQALGSLETLEYELGVRPRFVSYPAGEYDQSTLDIFHSAHYWAGVTTVQGATHSSDNLFELRRIRVRGTTTPDELIRLMALDW